MPRLYFENFGGNDSGIDFGDRIQGILERLRGGNGTLGPGELGGHPIGQAPAQANSRGYIPGFNLSSILGGGGQPDLMSNTLAMLQILQSIRNESNLFSGISP